VNGEMISSGHAPDTGKIRQRQVAVKASTVLSRTSVTGVPTTRGYTYVGGGPILAVGGLYLQTVHLENALTAAGPMPFYTTVGLGLYNPTTRSTKYLGAIERPQETLAQAKSNPKWSVNIDTPNLISIAGWLYLESTDFSYTPTGPTVHSLISVRARTADVVAAARAGKVTAWRKYLDGDWTSPAPGGASTDLEPDHPKELAAERVRRCVAQRDSGRLAGVHPCRCDQLQPPHRWLVGPSGAVVGPGQVQRVSDDRPGAGRAEDLLPPVAIRRPGLDDSRRIGENAHLRLDGHESGRATWSGGASYPRIDVPAPSVSLRRSHRLVSAIVEL
jgi:hypothetical protein